MRYSSDKRIIMTPDAGGTNFVFSAIRGNEQIIKELKLASNGNNLPLCLQTIVDGFTKVEEQLKNQRRQSVSRFRGLPIILMV